jgi:hypothetical protein
MAQKLFVEKQPQETIMSFRWFRNADIFFIVFATFWNGIVILMTSMAIANQEYEALLFMSVHTLVGLAVGWFTLSQVFNKTIIKISRFELDITHSPIPVFWRKTYRLNSKEISAIEVYEKLHKNKHRTWLSYGIQCKINRNDKEIKIIQGMETKENAEKVKEQLLSYLS